jgi:hypothetical protein
MIVPFCGFAAAVNFCREEKKNSALEPPSRHADATCHSPDDPGGLEEVFSMSVLNGIAYYQNRRDEVPNQELAHRLAESRDEPGIREIAGNLWNRNKNIRSDCLKVLYEIGYLRPELIAAYVEDFLKLLNDKENRMVWGGMIGLSTIADLRPQEIWRHIDEVMAAVEQGTLITVVWGIKTLARVAAADKAYSKKLFPILIGQLQKCMPRDLPMHAESVRWAVDAGNQDEFLAVLKGRQPELKASQLGRLRKAMKGLEG